jgi:hypothetical protein
MIRTDQKTPNPLFKGEVRLDGGREDRLLAKTMIIHDQYDKWEIMMTPTTKQAQSTHLRK